MRRPCLDCGTLTGSGSRCPAHQTSHDSARWARRTHYHGDWRDISRAARRAQPWCAECGATTDLTTDHITPRSLAAGVRVLCRRCNGIRGNQIEEDDHGRPNPNQRSTGQPGAGRHHPGGFADHADAVGIPGFA